MLRSDLWTSAFVRRHNDIGHICVVARRGDPVAGQIFVVHDHLNGKVSLYTPAPATARADGDADRIFAKRFDQVERAEADSRIERESRFDPDLWVIELETRNPDPGLTVAA